MLMGRASVLVKILIATPAKDAQRQARIEFVKWGEAYAEFTPLRGGELELSGQVESQPTVQFKFDFMEVMAPKPDGSRLDASMVLQIEEDGSFFDIDNIKPDLTFRKHVIVQAIGKTVAV